MESKKKVRRSTVATVFMLWAGFSMLMDILLGNYVWETTTGIAKIIMMIMVVFKVLTDITMLWTTDSIRTDERAKEEKKE